MASPAPSSTPAAPALKTEGGALRCEPSMQDMLRECIELCAQVAERHSAFEVAQQIRSLKPPSRWP